MRRPTAILAFVPLALVILALCAGCGGTYKATRLQEPPMEDVEKIIYKNLDLKASIGLVDLLQEDVNGLLKARVRLKNLTGKNINAEIKIKWVDASGFEIGNPAPWTPLPMDSGEVRSFEQIASSPAAVDFRVIIQRAGSH